MINRGDIKKMLRHLGVDAEGDLVADLWAVLDQDKNNKITFEEFAPVYVNWYRYGLRQEQKLMLKPEELRQVRALVRVRVRVRVTVRVRVRVRVTVRVRVSRAASDGDRDRVEVGRRRRPHLS